MKRRGPVGLAVLCLAVVAFVTGGGGTAAAQQSIYARALHRIRDGGLERRSLTFAERTRCYLLHKPQGTAPGEKVSLYLALHGGGGSGVQMCRAFPLHSLPAGKKAVVAYPDAVVLDRKSNWADGRTETVPGREAFGDVDDVGFLSTIVDDLSREFPVDRRRVFATGISNGAFMIQRMAAERADRFAAIVPIIGGMAEPVVAAFAPSSPVAVLVINGTADPLVPFEGGDVHFFRQKLGRTVPVRKIIDLWVRADGCGAEAKVAEIPDVVTDDGASAVSFRYEGGRGGTVVELIEVRGGGHTWPGGTQYVPKFFIGTVCRDFSALERVVVFCEGHPKGD